MRKVVNPGSAASDSSLVPYETGSFGASVIKGVPASSIPDNAIADGFNIITTPVDAYGRTGSRLWTDTAIPPMENRTGYTASKVGTLIVANANIFSEDDVGHFFVWPETEEEYDEIIDYVDATTVVVADAGQKPLTPGCRMVGRTNLWDFHKVQKRWVLMFGRDVYVADIEMSEFVKCMVISRDVPQSAISGYCDFDDESGIIFNSGGMFRIDFSTTTPLVYRINTPIPNVAIPGNTKTDLRTFQYHYLYSTARISSDGNIRHRLTPGCKIEHETGTNIWGDDYKDFSEIWAEEPIGEDGYTYGMLTCGPLAAPFDAVGGWTGLGVYASFTIEINGEGPYEVVCDFADCMNMTDVAAVIQAAMRDFWLTATCVFLDGRFVITCGRVQNGSITYCGVGAAGVDISDDMAGRFVDGARITYPGVARSKIIGPLYVPNVANTYPEERQWHETHFPIYRTDDLYNKYKINDADNQYNDPNMFTWAKDLRICAAFYATRDNGLVIALVGQFERADVGSTLEWDDGVRQEIIEYIDDQTVLCDTDYYYVEGSYTGACEIGNGRVMRVTQTGNLVTRTRGYSFSAADVRKTLHWANGYRSYVTRYVSANQVEVSDNEDKQLQGLTVDPWYRHYCDCVSDKTLDTRKTTLLLKQRFWQAIESGNVGIKIPGLVFVAQRGLGELSYGQVPDKAEYLCGYHDKAYQITKKIPGDIQFMWLFKNVLSIWTTSKTWRWAVDGYEYATNTNTKDAILVIIGLDVVDEDRGLFDWGSFEPVGDGKAMMLTSEPGGIGWRSYDGFQYGPNILEIAEVGNERLPEINDLQRATCTLYDGHMGLMLWARNR